MNGGRRSDSRLGLALLVAVAFATPTVARAEGEPSTAASSDDELSRLRAHGADLLRQIEALRLELATSEKARKDAQDLLDSMSRRLREALAAQQASYAMETRRREQEIATTRRELDSAKADEARQAARSADLEKTVAELRRAIEQREADRHKLESLVADLSRAAGEQDRARQDHIGALEQDLREARAREKTSREAAEMAQHALREEQQASQSKLEALQSVLQDTRSTGSSLHAKLDDAQRQNSALSRQVSDLQAGVRKVHELQTALQQKELRLQELAHVHDADTEEIRDLRAQRGSIETALREAKSEQVTRTASVAQLMSGTVDAPAPPPAGSSAVGDPGRGDADLREQLSLERERRETLEREVQRLTTNGNTEEKFVEAWKALQSARSEILVLGNQLAEERRNREDLEVALGRMKQESGGETQSTNDLAERLAKTFSERRAEADRLAQELQNANEVIVRLKGRLEANESPTNENKIVAELDQENQRLRATLKAAAEANQKLKDKADVAQRLAEMVYGKTR